MKHSPTMTRVPGRVHGVVAPGPSGSARARFTLVELLVVIAIIGILASLLLPALSAAKEKGKASLCVNNQKQLSLGMLLYAEDYDDTTVPYQEGISPYTRWWQYIQPHVGNNTDIIVCPSGKNKKTGYGVNTAVHRLTVLWNPPSIKMNKIKKPSETIDGSDAARLDRDTMTLPPDMWGELTNPTGNEIVWFISFPFSGIAPYGVNGNYTDTTSTWNPSRPLSRHQRQANFWFVDGHAMGMRVESVVNVNPNTADALYDLK